jgi:recombination protein RecT
MDVIQTPPTNGAAPPRAVAKTPLPPGLSKQVAREAGGALVGAFFEQNKAALAAVLPKHMAPDRMVKIALRCLRTTPKLMDCTLESLFGAVITCAQLGLEPNTPQGHIYLIPFENKRARKFEVQVIIGYKGLVDLARRSGEIESISTRAVFENDDFEIDYGTDEGIRYRPRLNGEQGEVIGFYAVAKMKGGGTQFEFMSRSAVEAIRDGSQGYQSAKRFPKDGVIKHPWVQNFEEMGRKTTIRRIAKYLPSSIELAGALALDGAAGDRAQGLDKVLEGVDWTEVAETEAGEAGGADGASRGAGITQEQTINTELPKAAERKPEAVAAATTEKADAPKPETKPETRPAAPAPAQEAPAAETDGMPEEPAGLWGEVE